jgi:hypothetical protein
LHSNDPPTGLALKPKKAEVDLTAPVGPLVIEVSGADAATVQVRVAGVASTFPAESFARTANVCDPSPSPEYAFGEVHEPHAPASSLHSNDAPASVALKVNDAAAEVTVPVGPPVIEVPGAVTSTVHVRVAGVASTSAPSLARTENVCDPLARLV